MKDTLEHTLPGHDVEMLDDVEIPLKNIEFTIEEYLLANGTWLDPQTRLLLAGIRDCVGRVAGTSRSLAERSAPGLV